MTGVKLFVSDKCLGLVESLVEFYSEAAWQWCVPHLYREAFAATPSTKVRQVAAMVEAIHAQEDKLAARLRHVAGTRWGTRRYLDMGRLKEQEEARANEAAA